MDVPPFRSVLVAAAPGRGLFGAKMAGELSSSGVAPAIVDAIYNARVFEMRITAEHVFEAFLAKRQMAA
jgi:CO/xanthine dehydrogenase Mo-binding subunit